VSCRPRSQHASCIIVILLYDSPMKADKVKSSKGTTKVARPDKLISLKLAPEVLEEVDALLAKMEKLPQYRAFPMSKQTVLRLAIEHGLLALRDEAEGK
jgi:hypothetical protein